MSNADEIRAKALAKAEQEIEEQTLHAKAREMYPEAIRVHSFDAYGAVAVVITKAETLGDAITQAEIDNPEALFMVRDSCLAFKPEWSMTDADHKRGDVVCPYIYRVERMRQYPQRQTLTWYVERDGMRLRRECQVVRETDVVIDFDTVRRGGDTTVANVTLRDGSGCFTDRVKWWSSPDHPNSFTLYSK